MNAGVIGFTSWSRTLTETVRHLQPLRQTNTKYVVEMVGDLGPPTPLQAFGFRAVAGVIAPVDIQIRMR